MSPKIAVLDFGQTDIICTSGWGFEDGDDHNRLKPIDSGE